MPRIGARRAAALLVCAAWIGGAPTTASAADGWSAPQQHGGERPGSSLGGVTSAIGSRGDVVVVHDLVNRLELLDRVGPETWQGPRQPPGHGDYDAGEFASNPYVSVAADGHAALVFWSNGTGPVALRRTPAGVWARLPAPPTPYGLGAVDVATGGVVTVLWQELDCPESGPCTERVMGSTFGSSGTWSPPEIIGDPEADGDDVGLPVLRSDASGALVVAYLETHLIAPFEGWLHRAMVTTRAPGGDWTDPVEVAPWDRCPWDLLLDVNDRGDAALAADCNGIMLARRPAGGSFGPSVEVLEADGPDASRTSLALGAEDAVAVGWRDWNDPSGMLVASGGLTGPLATVPIERTQEDGALSPQVAPLAGDALVYLGASQSSLQAYGSRLYSAITPAGSTAIEQIDGPQTTEDVSRLRLLGDRRGGAVAVWERVTGDYPDETRAVFTSTYGPLPDPPREEEPAGDGDPPPGEPGDGGGDANEPRPPEAQVPPIRVPRRTATLRVRLRGGLVASRRRVVRLRVEFEVPVSGRLWLADRAGRTLGRRTFRARAGVPRRVRVVLTERAMRRLRGGRRLRVRLIVAVRTAGGHRLRVVSPTTLRLTRR